MAATGWLWCNRHVPGTPLRLDMIGASNAGGQPGSTGDPADLGYTLPGGCTIYVDNSTPLTDYPTQKFGPIVGAIDELVNVLGFADPIVAVVRSEPGSSIAGWNSTYYDEVRTIQVTAGRSHATWVLGHGDSAQNESDANGYAAALLTHVGAIRRNHGAGQAVALVGFHQVEPLVYPYASTVVAAQVAHAASNQGVRFVDASDLEMSADSHYLGPSQITIGRRLARLLVQDLIVTP